MDLKTQREEIDKWVIQRLNDLVLEGQHEACIDLYDEFREWIDDPEIISDVMTISTNDI